MENNKIIELCTTDGRKSFYGKAKVIIKPDGTRQLLSYPTIVCEITSAGDFRRLWGGYSATTMCHINAFINLYGIAGGGAKWWNGLEVA